MRALRFRTLVWSASALLLCGTAAAQFNPEGRRKAKPPTSTATNRRATPPQSSGAKAEKGDALPSKGPSTEALIARYRAIVLAQPSAPFPLERLSELYRQRDGNLDKLIEDFSRRSEQSDGYAATVALGGLYAQSSRYAEAISTYQRAVALRPDAAEARLALARLRQQKGDLPGAYDDFETAYSRISGAVEREQVQRTLMQLAIDLKRFDEAKRHHALLVKTAKGSIFVLGELGRELMERGELARATKEFEQVVNGARGDNRALVPALRQLAQAQLSAGDSAKAITTLEQALRLVGGSPGEKRELLELLAEAYRGVGRLTEFVSKLESRGAAGGLELEQLGRLYEEVGRLDEALTTYRKALKGRPDDIDTRLKAIRLLQLRGDLETVIDEYRALIRGAPRNAEYVFQLAETLLAQGDRDAAISELRKLETRAGSDEDILSGLVNFYERVELKERALVLLQRLARSGTKDPQHLIELGNRYWRDNEPERAKQTWLKLRTLVVDATEAQLRLGDIYLEHDLNREALAAFRKAVELSPGQSRATKALALALERTAPLMKSRKEQRLRREQARAIWQTLLDNSGSEPLLAREARQHLVSSWHLEGSLSKRITPLQRRFEGPPPNAEAGRLLAELWLKLRKPLEAAHTLERVVRMEPGDIQSLERLERCYAELHRPRRAIDVLQKLTNAEPKRARDYYQRMAQLAAEAYDDELALRYARKVVELSPDDSESHRRLAQLCEQTQDYDLAIAAYQKAIAANDRAYRTYIELAELLITRARPAEAAQLLERVVVASPDDELVAQAARTSLQIHLGQDSLAQLERILLPQSLTHPERPIFRRLLVELYGALALPLAQTMQHAPPQEREQAATELRSIGKRATKPLLDALNDPRESQRKIALELLRYVENPSAGPALIAFAQADDDPIVRARSMAAIAPMRSPALLPRLEKVLFPPGTLYGDDSDPLASGAARAVALMGKKRALPLLRRMLETESPVFRAWASLGLGLLGESSEIDRLMRAAEDAEYGSLPQAAALFALGQLPATARSRELLSTMSESDIELVKAHAIWSLARIAAPEASDGIVNLLLADSSLQSRAGIASALDWIRKAGSHNSSWDARLLMFDGDLRDWLSRFDSEPATSEQAATALTALTAALSTAALREAKRSSERAADIAELFVSSNGIPCFSPLTTLVGQASTTLGRDATESAREVGRALSPIYVKLASDPSAPIRVMAVRFLASQSGTQIQLALTGALKDSDESVKAAALDALSTQPASDAIIKPIVLLLQSSDHWPMRVRAAETLAKIDGAAEQAVAQDALVERLESDRIAWVRESAAKALATSDQAAARTALERASRRDPEPRVRESLRALLGSSP